MRYLLLCLMTCVVCSPCFAQEKAATAESISSQGIEFLKQSQKPDGTWGANKPLGVTALVTSALLEQRVSREDPVVAKALKWMESHVHADGGIYAEGSKHHNYETSISLLAFSSANADGRYSETIKKAVDFLKGIQWDEVEGYSSDNPGYGGAGYGSHNRPDLSNTQFLLEALHSAGLSNDDPAFRHALTFVSRTQNLDSEHNDTPFAKLINDGGFYYTPAAGGTSQSGVEPNGGLRSYASMTYAGLKSMIYAGVSPDDKRVKAAEKWIKTHYSLSENPGMGQQGLFYYYHTFAKTLNVLGYEDFVDAEGKKHNWQQELVAQLASTQQPNGSWINKQDRWYEGDPDLVTAYALLALVYCN